MQNVKHFCERKGVKPTTACVESGAGRNLITYVKRGQEPSLRRVELLAAYLGVTIGQLIGESEASHEKKDLSTGFDAEAALNDALVERLYHLTPEELARVDAFVQGLLSSR